MNFRIPYLFVLLILFSQATAEDTGTVFFIDSSSQNYLRSRSSNDVVEHHLMSLPEVGATVSVLLGFAPPSTLSSAASTKLNDILTPNPFNRPGAVFALEIRGFSDPKLIVNHDSKFGSVLASEIYLGSKRADIQLPGEDAVSVVSLDEPLANYDDKDIGEFASWLGGAYVADPEPLNGVLIIPSGSGVNMNFDISKKRDREFVESLLSLVGNTRRAIKMHEDISESLQRPSELISGCFDGMKGLQKQDGSEGVNQHGEQLLLATLSKIFKTLQEAYKGQIVGVIFCHETSPSEPGKMLNVIFTSQPSPRWLVEETETAKSTAILEVLLVRRTLAWVTGIILLIATLLGIHFLLNMQLTRDTLLYSNVKLD